nr:SDR family oxidoreductase [Ciceribacter lividus]
MIVIYILALIQALRRIEMQTALITGASAGIGAVYARRFASRGFNLVLVARSSEKLEDLSAEIASTHAVEVEILSADLTNPAQLAAVSERLSKGDIDVLVNNAGAALLGTFEEADAAAMERLLALNVTAPTLLASAVVPGMVKRGSGAIINLGSVVSLMPQYFPGIYSATKSYMLTLSQGLSAEVGQKGVYVQAVLPAATRTEIWEKAGADLSQIPNVMEVDDLVDAALVGFDLREAVTIPPLADAGLWDALEQARAVFPSGLGGSPAARYLNHS